MMTDLSSMHTLANSLPCRRIRYVLNRPTLRPGSWRRRACLLFMVALLTPSSSSRGTLGLHTYFKLPSHGGQQRTYAMSCRVWDSQKPPCFLISTVWHASLC